MGAPGGGSAQPAVVTVDDAAFAATVEKARRTLDAKPVEDAISLKGGKVAVRRPVTGTTTDVPGTAGRAPLVARRQHRRGGGHGGRAEGDGRRTGKLVKTQKFTTSYRPEDDVTCINAKP